MAITLPYTPTANIEYGSIQWSSSTVTSAGTYYEYRTMTSQGYSTINSFTKQADGSFLMNITIYSYSLITRTNTGYARGAMTFQTTPLIQVYNQALGTAITVYNASLTTSVNDSTSGSITHSTTLNISIPATWFQSGNDVWYLITQQVVTCTTTGETTTHIKTESTFQVLLAFNIVVRYANTLRPVINMWVRYNDALYPVKGFNVDYNGVLK